MNFTNLCISLIYEFFLCIFFMYFFYFTLLFDNLYYTIKTLTRLSYLSKKMKNKKIFHFFYLKNTMNNKKLAQKNRELAIITFEEISIIKKDLGLGIKDLKEEDFIKSDEELEKLKILKDKDYEQLEKYKKETKEKLKNQEFIQYQIKKIPASEKVPQHKVERISTLVYKDLKIPILKTLKYFHKITKKHDYSKSSFIKWVDSTNFNLQDFEKWKNGVNFKTGRKITIGKQIHNILGIPYNKGQYTFDPKYCIGGDFRDLFLKEEIDYNLSIDKENELIKKYNLNVDSDVKFKNKLIKENEVIKNEIMTDNENIKKYNLKVDEFNDIFREFKYLDEYISFEELSFGRYDKVIYGRNDVDSCGCGVGKIKKERISTCRDCDIHYSRGECKCYSYMAEYCIKCDYCYH